MGFIYTANVRVFCDDRLIRTSPLSRCVSGVALLLAGTWNPDPELSAIHYKWNNNVINNRIY